MENCEKCGATMTAQGKSKFVCEFCGNTVDIETNYQAAEQQRFEQHEVVRVDKSEEKLGCWLTGLCAIIPIVGLILFLVYKSQGAKAKSQTAIIAAIIGFIVGIILEIGGIFYFE
jgi:DNA-directed RNA polymerase subunit M/transcription elongation factor TFIIS